MYADEYIDEFCKINKQSFHMIEEAQKKQAKEEKITADIAGDGFDATA